MKKKIKGFTLIELLATVIILAIVLLIAVPQVLNMIEKTRKKAFIDSVLSYSKSTRSFLDTQVINSDFVYPKNPEFMLFNTSNLSTMDDNYDGDILILRNKNDKLLHYPYLTDGKYYVCGVNTEILDVKYIKDSECVIPSKDDIVTIIDGIDINNSVDTDGDGIPDIIEDNHGTDKDDPSSKPSIDDLDKEDYSGINNAYEDSNNELAELEYNHPVLAEGMIPIVWSNNGDVIETTFNDPNWFSYTEEKKQWANAKTADGSMWVWIPRYAYKITSGYHSSEPGVIEVNFLAGTTNNMYKGGIAAAVNQGNNPGSDKMFVTHPAFKFGDDELKGIWIAKFQASDNNKKLSFIPNVESLTHTFDEYYMSGSVGIFDKNAKFTIVRSMETNSVYGWGTSGKGIDTHLLKEVEWGAATYFAWSKYGKNGSIWANNSYGLVTGCGASSATNIERVTVCENKYNTPIGANASTTGNYYGIYDMNGGIGEVTSSYIIEYANPNDTYGMNYTLVVADKKYSDQYSNAGNTTICLENDGYYGNAMYETIYPAINEYGYDELRPWDSTSGVGCAESMTPNISRGNFTRFGSSIFNFINMPGYTFRATLLVQNGL